MSEFGVDLTNGDWPQLLRRRAVPLVSYLSLLAEVRWSAESEGQREEMADNDNIQTGDYYEYRSIFILRSSGAGTRDSTTS